MTCARCGSNAEVRVPAVCPACGGPIAFVYDAPLSRPPENLSLWAFAAWLPVRDPAYRLTLGEGGTPLLQARGDYGCRLWWKDEGRNPTGSHKDRALAVALSVAREADIDTVVLASAGSTGLSAAAYSAAAGMRCLVLVPYETPSARTDPLLLYGATVIRFPGSIDDAFAVLTEVRAAGIAMDVSTIRDVNPFQAEAPRTIAFEVASQLGDAPDWMIIPTGGGGTLSGIARGFAELHQAKLISQVPKLAAVQPSAYNTLERELSRPDHRTATLRELEIDTSEPTVLSKLAHTIPPDGLAALASIRTTDGAAVSVSDAEALASQKTLARAEGLFVEPSAAAGLAGLQRLLAQHTISEADRVVVCLTGSGYRMQDELSSATVGQVEQGPADLNAAWMIDRIGQMPTR